MAIDGEDEMSCNGHDTSLDSLDVLHKHLKEPLLKNLSDPPVPARWKRRLKPLQKYMKDHDQSPVTWLGLAMFFGILCGLVCFVYAHWFRALLWLVWQYVPQRHLAPALEHWNRSISWFPAPGKVAWVYTVLVSSSMGLLVGLTQVLLGTPGDLPETVKNIHEKGFVPPEQAPSMFVCSAFSIVAGGSLGPEAALLALCGAAVSFTSKHLLGYRGHNLRNCALLGMTAGLAAFFGVALGGSLFALEVLHRTGMQFFEVATFAVFCGVSCLVVFRGLSQESFGAVWDFKSDLQSVDWHHVVIGACMGVIAAGVAVYFMEAHKIIKKAFHRCGLDEHKTPVLSGLVGGCLIGLISVVATPVAFWGEFEINTLADNSRPLPHVWPQGGIIWGLEPYYGGDWWPWWLCLILCLVKMIAISITVLSGFRGGFIFPMFFAGTAFGQAIARFPIHIPFISGLPAVLPCMAIAAGLETAITRTPLATALILANLSGDTGVTVPCLASAMVSLYITLYRPFIASQRDRSDVTIKKLDEELDTGDGLIKITQRSEDGSQATAIIGNHTFEVSVEEREVNRQGTIGIALHVGSPGPDLSPEDVGGV